MAQHLVNRRGYWSLEESYRDARGRPRKRYLKYLGRRSDDPQARMSQMLATAERKADEIDEMQRAQFGETGAERQERLLEEKSAALPAGLHVGPIDPVPLEKNVVDAGGAVSTELDNGQCDDHEAGKDDNADDSGDGNSAIGEVH